MRPQTDEGWQEMQDEWVRADEAAFDRERFDPTLASLPPAPEAQPCWPCPGDRVQVTEGEHAGEVGTVEWDRWTPNEHERVWLDAGWTWRAPKRYAVVPRATLRPEG